LYGCTSSFSLPFFSLFFSFLLVANLRRFSSLQLQPAKRSTLLCPVLLSSSCHANTSLSSNTFSLLVVRSWTTLKLASAHACALRLQLGAACVSLTAAASFWFLELSPREKKRCQQSASVTTSKHETTPTNSARGWQ
jgi:hypothetical protein